MGQPTTPTSQRIFAIATAATVAGARSLVAGTSGSFHLGLVTYNVAKEWDLDTILGLLPAAGFEGVEFRSTHAHGVEISLSPAERAEVRRKCAAAGLKQVSLGTACEFHSPDPAVPIEDSIGELPRLKDEGKIACLGVSNVDRAQLERACAVAAIASVQNRASPYAAEGLTDGVLDYCEANDIAFIAYSPVGGSDSGRTAGEAPLCRVGDAIGATPFEVALAWLLAKSPALIPIPGARQAQNARSSARAAAITLSAEQLESIDDAYGGVRR